MSWHWRSRATIAVTCLFVALAACSDDAAEPGGSEGEVSSSSATGDSTAAPLGSSESAGAPPGAEVLGTVQQGKPLEVTVLASNTADDPARWRFTVDRVVCGKPLDPAVMAHAAQSVGAPTATPAPETGKQFCVLSMQAVNVGKSMASWNADSTVSLNVGDIRYTQSQKDASYSSDYAQYWNDRGEVAPTFGLNPGSQGPVHGVFQIPAGDKPASVWVTSGTAIETIDGAEPGHLVLLK
ncbi:hypothetical protein QFZ24_000311 [Streptomyces phaeochromogenes]|jgi:hypothetical protein|uniref:hypothetical protein n=1 Tax=Streptomyces phaeochromogenes TaxID=1923 RepID=UPI002791C26D|nr:hypothetical protein [Streptomyces phaeochromogenes]MDQ0946388.1 hypothetical protein [Streptomyces phaeochromogenes]